MTEKHKFQYPKNTISTNMYSYAQLFDKAKYIFLLIKDDQLLQL